MAEQQSQEDSHVPATAADAVRDIKSPGVQRIEAISSCITFTDRVFIFISVFLVAYVYGLDGTVRYTYQTTATNDFGQHSLFATINVVRAVIAAAAQPTAAKIADVFGRVELVCVSVFFYVIGSVIEAVATNVTTFAGGSVLYQIGYTSIILLVEVIIADITSTRARLFFSYLPALPFIINTWAAGPLAQAVLKITTWHWGIGMFCIIYPAVALPLVISLSIPAWRAKKLGRLDNYRSSFQQLGMRNFGLELFWLLDVVGILLVIIVFGLILAPLTIAGGFKNSWQQAKIIAPIVIGVVFVPVFVLWELRCPHPLVPFKLMKDRSVWAPIGIAIFLNFAWTLQGDYLFTVLQVSFDFSYARATTVTQLYSFTSVLVGPLVGLAVYKIRRLKPFIVAGTSLFLVAFGLLIHYRGSANSDSRSGVIGAQVVLGIAGGLFPYTAQASLQVFLKHENLAVMTALYLAVYNIGSALGYTVSGALWTQLLPSALDRQVPTTNQTLLNELYGSPLTAITQYPVGNPIRDGMIDAYLYIQKMLCIVGICLAVPLLGFSLSIRNPKLNDQQTLAKDFESDTETERDTNEVPRDAHFKA